MSDREYFRAHRAGDPGPFVGRPVVNRISGDRTFFLSRRLAAPDGRFLGVVLGVIKTDYFAEFFTSVSAKPGTSITLFRRDGVVLARYPDNQANVGRSLTAHPMFTSVMARADHAIVHTDGIGVDDIARIMSPRAVRNYPLVINVTETTDSVLAEWRSDSRLLALVAAAVILMVILCGVLSRRYLESQMRMARTEAESREAGRASAQIRGLNRALRLVSRGNEALIRIQDEPALLREICQIAVDIGGYRMAWVGYARNDAAKTIEPVAHAGYEAGYLSPITVSWAEDDPHGQGPSGRVVRTGRPVVITDMAEDPTLRPWWDEAMRRGYGGMIALPLRDGPCTFGSFALYTPEPRAIQQEELRLLAELADNLSFGISAIRNREERARVQAAVTKVAAAVSASTGTSFFEQLAGNMVEALGADAAFISRLLPGEPGRASTIATVIDGKVGENFDYPLDGTACGDLVVQGTTIVPAGVVARFPAATILADLQVEAYVGHRLDNAAGQPLGLLLVMFRRPLAATAFVTSTMRIFAARAAAELERRDVEARLREQASLLDKAKDAILVRAIDHRILFWNKGAERLYGWCAEEVIGKSVEELLYAEPSAFRDATARVLADGTWTGELVQRRKDGSLLTAEGNWTLVRDEVGRAQSILAINTDITARRAMEQQLQQSQRLEAVGQLTGGLAHDFNNLLTVILGNAEALADELSPGEHCDMVEIIRTAASRGADLTHRLLAFARRQTLAPRTVQPNVLIDGMRELLRRTLSASIDIVIHGAPDLAEARVDPAQLEGALLNLCLNARDAMPDGGRLIIETSNVTLDADYAERHAEVKAGDYVLVTVSDTGVGIDPQDLRRVFDPFFTTKDVGKGTGLGLSMVYGFLKQSGGHVNIYSEIGLGTTVHMYLPVAEQRADTAESTSPAPLALGASESVLVVEDDDLVRQHSVRQLGNLGYRVLAARNGAEALDVLKDNPDLDLLFTDMVMPGALNGRQLAAAALEIRPSLKVLYTSGYTEQAMVAQEPASTGFLLLKKPYRRDELARKVRAALTSA